MNKQAKSKRSISTQTGLVYATTLTIFALSNAKSAPTLNTEPPVPAPTYYSRPGMAAYNFMMDDALLGNLYEKTVWNLHDALKLPDWLSVGLEHRTRYETLAGAFKGSAGSTPQQRSQGGDQIIAFQTDLWIQAKFKKFRIAAEFMDARTAAQDNGENNAVPYPINNSSVDTLDFAQGYISWADQNFLRSGLGTEIKAGRQTFDLGSRRLVARPIYRNTVNNFTGIRARIIDYDHWQLNAFVTVPVLRYPNYNSVTPNQNLQNRQQFDHEDTNSWFAGGILEGSNLFKNVNAELYLYYLGEGDSGKNPTRNRRYFTPGFRLFIKPSKGNIDFQAEGMGQFGTVNYAATSTYANTQQTHEAWSSHVELGYSFDLPWSLRFFLEHDYASGSKNWSNKSASAVDGRFDPLYGASDFEFGPTGIYGAFQRSNINSPGYKLNFSPRNDLEFSIQQRLVWLASDQDCWGGNTCTAATTPALANGKGSFVGDQIAFRGRYNFNSSLNFEAGWYHLFKGSFAETAKTTNSTGGTNGLASGPSTPGVDTDYFFVQTQLRF